MNTLLLIIAVLWFLAGCGTLVASYRAMRGKSWLTRHGMNYRPLWPHTQIVRVHGAVNSVTRITFWVWWVWESQPAQFTTWQLRGMLK